MNDEVRDLAKWASQNGWDVTDDAKGYTRFYDPNGEYVAFSPAAVGRVALSKDLVCSLAVPLCCRAAQPSRSQIPPSAKARHGQEGRGRGSLQRPHPVALLTGIAAGRPARPAAFVAAARPNPDSV